MKASRSARKKTALSSLILILLVGVLSYSNTLHNPFVFDDRSDIVELEGVCLDNFSPSELAELWQTIQDTGRSVARISFALNYYFGKLDTFGYHLFNLSIHLLTALSFYFFLKLTLTLPGLQERYEEYSGEIALFSSLLFVAHPIQIQAVTYIVQRMTSMAALFFILALYFYGQGRLAEGQKRTAFFAACALSALLALGSKENAITLPFFIALYEYYFFQKLELGEARKKWFYAIIGITLTVVMLGLIYTNFEPVSWLNEKYQIRAFTPGQRMLTQLRVVVFYLGLLFLPLPSRFNLDHHFPLSYSLLNPPTTLLCFGLVLGLIAGSIYLAKKRPLISFALIWFLGNLALESTFLPLELIFEHRMYLPSAGVFLLVGILVIKGIAQVHVRQGIKVGFLLAIIIALSSFTYQRNSVWQDEVVLWEDAASKSPNKNRVWFNLGCIYENRRWLAKAIAAYRRTLELTPGFRHVNHRLGLIYYQQGKFNQSIVEFLKEIKLHPDNEIARKNLKNAYQEQRWFEETIAKYRNLIETDPGYKGAHNNLGRIYLQQGNLEQAVTEFLKEIESNPDDAEVYYNLGNVYRKQGKFREAIGQYQHVLAIDSRYEGIHNNLGGIYCQQGKPEQAISEYLEEISLNPDNVTAHYNLGVIYASKGLTQQAEQKYQTVLKLNPKHDLARKALMSHQP